MTLDDPGQFHLVLGTSRNSANPCGVDSYQNRDYHSCACRNRKRGGPGEPGFAKPKELVHPVDARVPHWVNAVAMPAVIGLEICGR